jgi:hypothetical protein
MARGVFDRKLWRVVALPLTILQSRRVAGTAKTPFFMREPERSSGLFSFADGSLTWPSD